MRVVRAALHDVASVAGLLITRDEQAAYERWVLEIYGIPNTQLCLHLADYDFWRPRSATSTFTDVVVLPRFTESSAVPPTPICSS